jgi:membrane fusion protein, multidrug efflux system
MSRHDPALAEKAGEVPTALEKPAPVTAAPVKAGGRKKKVLGALAFVVLGLGGWYGNSYWTHGRYMIETNDAYVAADISMISSRIQGYVAAIPAHENAMVKAGDVLVQLDDGDYRIALQVAESRVATAGETLSRIDAQIVAARASVAQAEAMRDVAAAQLRNATTQADRVRRLAAENIAAQAQLDTAVDAQDTATATLASAAAALANAKAQISVLNAQHAESEGTLNELTLAVDQARRNLDLTTLRAPADGTIANLTLEMGDLVAPGARLAALVPQDALYIEANFKETQMSGITVGADVAIHFDALPGQSFAGKVLSLAPATGSVFSLLPADNATGNFTKIVQRVPVRIAIPQAALATGRLRAGLSSTVEVDRRTGQTLPAVAE